VCYKCVLLLGDIYSPRVNIFLFTNVVHSLVIKRYNIMKRYKLVSIKKVNNLLVRKKLGL
jgi:hypothetical protein